MASIFERMKRRTEQFGGFFKGILVPRDSNTPGNPDNSKIHQGIQITDDVYDDTGASGKNSGAVLDWESSRRRYVTPPRPGPRDRDIMPFDPLLEGSLFSPGQDSGSILGRTMLGMFESAFGFGVMQEIDSAMRDMDAAFSQMDRFMEDEDDDHRYSRFFGQGFPLDELDLENSPADHNENHNRLIDPDANYRDQMLKPDRDRNAKKLQPRISPSPSDPHSRSWNWGTSSSTIQTYSSVNGKVQSQIIRETPEGREIITQTQDGKGVAEEHREFIPRKDLPPEQSIFTKIFRPKF